MLLTIYTKLKGIKDIQDGDETTSKKYTGSTRVLSYRGRIYGSIAVYIKVNIYGSM